MKPATATTSTGDSIGIRSRGEIGGAGAVAALLAVLVVSTAGATPPGRDGLIAYVSHGSPNRLTPGIVLVKPDGSGLRQLTRDFRDKSPAWSPDGSKLVFVRAGRLHVIRSDGSGLRRVTPLQLDRVRAPTWSPDGRSIAFVRGGRTIYVMRRGSDPADLQAHDLGQPTLLVTGWQVDRVWSVGRRATTQPRLDRRHTKHGVGRVRYVTDGEIATGGRPASMTTIRAALVSLRTGWHQTLVWLAIAVTRKRSSPWREPAVRCPSDQHDTSYEAHRPSWSPSGSRIAAETSEGVAILTAAGQRLRILDRLGTEPVWQPLK